VPRHLTARWPLRTLGVRDFSMSPHNRAIIVRDTAAQTKRRRLCHPVDRASAPRAQNHRLRAPLGRVDLRFAGNRRRCTARTDHRESTLAQQALLGLSLPVASRIPPCANFVRSHNPSPERFHRSRAQPRDRTPFARHTDQSSQDAMRLLAPRAPTLASWLPPASRMGRSALWMK